MEDIKREIYEQDAKEAMAEEAYEKHMLESGYEQCSECDAWVEDLYYGICDDCIHNIVAETDFETACDYAKQNGDELNFLNRCMRTEDKITELLKATIKQCLQHDKHACDKEIIEYLEEDELHYIDYLRKKGDL